MIAGIGIDIVEVERLENWLKRSDAEKLMLRFFHADEIAAACSNKKTAPLSLAARFAAKEAFGKALGTGLRGIRLKDICVKTAHNGKPELELYGTALSALDKNEIKKTFVSLSHEKTMAVAVVVLEN